MAKKEIIEIDLNIWESLPVDFIITLLGIVLESDCFNINVDHYDRLIEDGYIIMEGFKPVPTEKTIQKINKKSVLRVQKAKKLNLVSDTFVDRYRNLFKGLKPGSMGYRQAVVDKLNRFMMDNRNVTEEQIIKATKRYLDSQDNYNFLQQADYFIYKRESGGSESSRLSIFIEELSNDNNSTSGDWTSTLI